MSSTEPSVPTHNPSSSAPARLGALDWNLHVNLLTGLQIEWKNMNVAAELLSIVLTLICQTFKTSETSESKLCGVWNSFLLFLFYILHATLWLKRLSGPVRRHSHLFKTFWPTETRDWMRKLSTAIHTFAFRRDLLIKAFQRSLQSPIINCSTSIRLFLIAKF